MSGTIASMTIVGRLTRDAELKHIASGEALVKFSLATDYRVKRDGAYVDEPSFWNVDFWGKRAESVAQYLTKGKPVAVSGEARIEKWESGGKSGVSVIVNASTVALLPMAPGKVDRGDGPGEDVPF